MLKPVANAPSFASSPWISGDTKNDSRAVRRALRQFPAEFEEERDLSRSRLCREIAAVLQTRDGDVRVHLAAGFCSDGSLDQERIEILRLFCAVPSGGLGNFAEALRCLCDPLEFSELLYCGRALATRTTPDYLAVTRAAVAVALKPFSLIAQSKEMLGALLTLPTADIEPFVRGAAKIAYRGRLEHFTGQLPLALGHVALRGIAEMNRYIDAAIALRLASDPSFSAYVPKPLNAALLAILRLPSDRLERFAEAARRQAVAELAGPQLRAREAHRLANLAAGGPRAAMQVAWDGLDHVRTWLTGS